MNLMHRPSPATHEVERPEASSGTGVWASDAIAHALRSLDIPYVALNPGSSFRGLYDSLVNELGNASPQMLACLHEESAVALAHGWSKVTGTPMLAVVHSSVGLMHASMAIFNAWCDRVPMVLLGATGPVDAQRRRPWIDWIHTSRDQASMIRGFIKWDDQPSSVDAAVEAVLRANLIARTVPCGPTYVCLDVGLQESPLSSLPAIPDVGRYGPPKPGALSHEDATAIADLLARAERPLVLMGRVSRNEQAWSDRVRLAESLGALVVTDSKVAASFPSRHRLVGAHAAMMPSAETLALVASADAILSLDWVDLGGTLKAAYRGRPVSASVVQISPDQHLHGGWNMDYQALPCTDHYYTTTPEEAVKALLGAVADDLYFGRKWPGRAALEWPELERSVGDEKLRASDIAAELRQAIGTRPNCIIRHPFAWASHFWDISHPLDWLGYDGGGGVGSGPGMAVGAALALKGSDRLPVAVVGDGDFLMGVTALWTAVHYGIPLLLIVSNNSAFYNDEIHQERVANDRGRPVANKWIGQHITDPEVDLAAMAAAQGCKGIGPVRTVQQLADAIREGIAHVDAGGVAVLDVRVRAGYGDAMSRMVEHVQR